MSNTCGDKEELNFSLSSQDLSGLGPDVQNALRQLATSQREHQQGQTTGPLAQSATSARFPSRNGPGVIHRSASLAPTAALPGRNEHHHLITDYGQHQVEAHQPREMVLDDFDRQLLADHEPPEMRAPYVASDYYTPFMPAASPFSAARFMPAPSSSLSSAANSTAPTRSLSRLTLPSSHANSDVRATATPTLYSPAPGRQPIPSQFHNPIYRTTSPFWTGYSDSFPAPRRPPLEHQRSQSRDAEVVTQRIAPEQYQHINSKTRITTAHNSSSPAGVGSSSSPAAKADLRRQLPQSLPDSSRLSTASASSNQNSQSLNLSHAPPIVNGINLINPREVLPDRFREIFPYDVLNAVQSKCFEHAYQTNENLVVSAPTGSGKTAILELAICKLAHLKGSESFKIVYLCPLKALCAERANDWRRKFRVLAMEVAELTGDTSEAEMRRVRQATVIVTTPEKWDSITRSWSDHRKLLDLVELFLIDEVHLLKEPRGSTLEAVVSRMKTRGANVRFVALSATVPNSDDVARWLGRDHTSPGIPARRAIFGEEFRPVKLQKFVYGFDRRTNDYQFDTFLTEQLYAHIAKHSQKKPILVFCQTRKSCQSSAKKLAEEWNERQPQLRPWPEPTKRIPVISPELQEIVRYGVAFHHAGLDSQDRRAVEQAFLDGRLHVICCTSTLAMGLNLPCHMVVLKGTTSYQEGAIAELSDLEFMQMLGRAGRPQFGSSGIAVVLTRARNKQHYEDMGSGQQILESTLHQNLIEHLNSEINLGTFQDIPKAKEWLKGTFLAVRLDRNPAYYKLTDTSSLTDPLDDRLEEICETDISKLQQSGLVTEGATFRSTDYGWTMSRYVIRFNSMQKILQIPRAARMEQVLTALCEADEFREFRWRTHERDVFRELNRSPFIVYPIRETITTMAHRVSLLLQVALGCVDLSNVPEVVRRQMTLDTGLLFEKMHRLVRAVIECKASDMDGVTCRVAHELARSMAARAWEGKSMQLTQIPQVGPVFMRKLVASGISTVHNLVKAGAMNIERILSRNPPFGKKMMDELAHFPHLTLEARIATDNPRGFRPGKQPVVRIDAVLGFSNTLNNPKWRGKIPSVTFIAETTQGVLAHWWRGSLKKFKEEDGHKLSIQFEVDLSDVADEITCYFACEDIVGTVVTRKLEHGLPAAAFPPKLKATPQFLKPPNQSTASWMDDDIGDNDLLEVTREESSEREACIAMSGDSDDDSQWPVIDCDKGIHIDYESSTREMGLETSHDNKHEEPPWHPVQLPNGKFKCNHRCADVGLKNSSGKACAHKCCREGLDVPRKPKRSIPKRKADVEEIAVAGSISHPTSKPPTKRAKTTISKESKSETSGRIPSEPPVDVSANKRVHSLIDLDNFDFELDDDGFVDLTQVEGTDVDALQGSHRSRYRAKKRTSENNSHAELLKTQSNSTDNFSDDSVFDGVGVNEVEEKSSLTQDTQVGTKIALEKRLRDISSHNNDIVGEEGGLNDMSFNDSDEENCLFSDMNELRTSHTSPPTHDASSQHGRTTEIGAIESEEDTYIFSDKYVLPPPRDSVGEGSVIHPGSSFGEHLPCDVDTKVEKDTARVDLSSKHKPRSENSPQEDLEWGGFDPWFTDEFRDFVEFI